MAPDGPYTFQMNNDGKPGTSPDSDALTRDPATESKELAALVSYLQTTSEAERSLLAKELHDELGGLITAAKMDMQWLAGKIGGSLDVASDEKFKSVMQMLNQAMMLKRRVVESLRPSLLDHFGLPVALRSHYDELCGKAGLDCVSTLPDDSIDLPLQTQLALFRVAQEVLANVLARGNAKHVELVIDTTDEGYLMQIGDDSEVPSSEQDSGLGSALTAMRYRVQHAGGTLESVRSPGQGNRIRVYVPRSRAGSG
jgi:signal transduction histidine kinase